MNSDWLVWLFGWIDKFPIWVQIVIGTLFGLVCMAIIVFSIIGMQKITYWFNEKIRDLMKWE